MHKSNSFHQIVNIDLVSTTDYSRDDDENFGDSSTIIVGRPDQSYQPTKRHLEKPVTFR